MSCQELCSEGGPKLHPGRHKDGHRMVVMTVPTVTLIFVVAQEPTMIFPVKPEKNFGRGKLTLV